jgi:hypothetical protein
MVMKTPKNDKNLQKNIKKNYEIFNLTKVKYFIILSKIQKNGDNV